MEKNRRRNYKSLWGSFGEMKFNSFITKLIRHELVSGSAYVFAGSIFANFLAFLLNLFLARNLSYVDYGIFASLISVVILASIPAGSITTIIVKFASDYHSKNELGRLQNFYKKSFKFIIAFSFFTMMLFVIFSPLIKNFLHLDNIFYILIVGLCVVAGYIQVVNLGFLQAIMKFGFLSFTGVLSNIVKLIIGVLFVFLGFRVFSGLWSIIFMGLSGFLIGFIPLRFIFSKNTDDDIHVSTKEILRYALPVFITVLFMTSFTSTDVILVKHFFSSQQAGFYAGLSLIGKVIFYFTTPIPFVMFPLLIRRKNSGKSFNKLFYLALILVLLPSLTITGFYFIFPKLVVNMFLGGKDYLEIAGLAGFFGINLTIFSLINVFINFFLSLNRTKIVPLIVISALAQIILIYIFHNNFSQIITISILVLSVLLIVLAGYYLKLYTTIGRKAMTTSL
jgi:O-antigen/teichoic acid export membrane protein